MNIFTKLWTLMVMMIEVGTCLGPVVNVIIFQDLQTSEPQQQQRPQLQLLQPLKATPTLGWWSCPRQRRGSGSM